MDSTYLEKAMRLYDGGWCLVACPHGSKFPTMPWKQYHLRTWLEPYSPPRLDPRWLRIDAPIVCRRLSAASISTSAMWIG